MNAAIAFLSHSFSARGLLAKPAGCAVLALLFGLYGVPFAAALELPPVLGSHMVLQRDQPVPIWGTASPGEKIVVTFRTQRKQVTADAKGGWVVRLDPLPAGGPDTLTIAGAETIVLENVLVGEVWVGSGQSNMAHVASVYVAKDPVLADLVATPRPTVRLLRAHDEGWLQATPETMPRFSAQLIAFGVRLQEQLDVPVGLIAGAVAGTPSGFWISQDALDGDPACQAAIALVSTPEAEAKVQQDYQRRLDQWNRRMEAIRSEAARNAGATSTSGPRKPLPPPAPGQCAQGRVGHLYEDHIRPLIPFGIRGVLWDQGENGTGITGVDQFILMRALIAGWRTEWGQGEFPFLYVQKPSGGGCALNFNDPVSRSADAGAPLPAAPPAGGGGIQRELHLRIMRCPNTAMVISSDLGGGLHPANKSGYGTRAARVASGFVYGQPVEYYGPLYESHQIEEGRVRIRFSHVGKGLAIGGRDTLQGFQIASDDRRWRWADALVESDAVVVSHPEVSDPVAVRYAWDARIPWANLFNKDGLPAQTFRTDDW
jgi:sialate O-acetylesterase